MYNSQIQRSRDDTHIYVNLSIYNPSDSQDLVASYQKTFDEVVLPDPSEYECSVVRFSIGGQDIPIINWRNYLQTGSTTNTILNVRFVYNSVNYDAPVVWAPFGPVIEGESKYYCYDYGQIATLVNNTFQTLTTTVNAAGAGITVTPRLEYDPNTSKFYLYAEKAKFGDNILGGVQIWFLQVLYDLFQSLPIKSFDTSGYIRLSITEVLNPASNTTTNNSKTIGATDCWVMAQNYNTLNQLNTARSIVITSDLPIVQEYINSLGQAYDSNVSTIQLPILSDFILDPNIGYDIFTQLSYAPTAEYRMADMVSSSQLNKISVNFYWSDQAGVLHNIVISPKKSISLKLLFRKKGYHSGKKPYEVDFTNNRPMLRKY